MDKIFRAYLQPYIKSFEQKIEDATGCKPIGEKTERERQQKQGHYVRAHLSNLLLKLLFILPSIRADAREEMKIFELKTDLEVDSKFAHFILKSLQDISLVGKDITFGVLASSYLNEVAELYDFYFLVFCCDE